MKRIVKLIFSFALCVVMVLSMMPTVFAADDVCILEAYDRATLNDAFNTINNGSDCNKYVIKINPPSQQDGVGVLDAEGDTYEITRGGIEVSIEAAPHDANDGDESKIIQNATFAITRTYGPLSTLNIGYNTTNDCKLIMEGGGYGVDNGIKYPNVKMAMLHAFGKVRMNLGDKAVFQNNYSLKKAGCLLVDGDPHEYSRSEVYLEGATIRNCSTDEDVIAGDAVFVQCGKFVINSGTITECVGKNSTVFVHGSYGKFEMHGGSITNCTATRADGGAIHMNANDTSDLWIDGGIITGNTCGNNDESHFDAGHGGGIFIQNGCYRISGNAQIYGNTANWAGDDIYVTGTGKPIQSYLNNISYNDSYHWFYDSKVSERWSADSPTDMYSYVPKAKLTYVGLKAVKTPKVTYEYNGTVPAEASDKLPAASTEVCGSTVDVENAPDVTGYTFSGWQTSDVIVDAGKFIMPDQNVTFAGSFSPITYNITYNLEGGTVSTENPATYTIESADISLNNPKKTGYTFAGWTGTGITTAQQTVSIPTGSTGEREYTANWKKKTNGLGENDPQPAVYTVTFNMNGHGDLVAEQKVNEGEKATKPADPTESGYTFDGWYADENFSEAFDFNTAINADTTLYAKWTESSDDPTVPVTYTISYDLNGGTMDGKTGIVTVDVEKGAVITLPTPTREGYEFDYWQGSKYKAGDRYTVTEDHTFTAQWKDVNEVKPDNPTESDNPAEPDNPTESDNSTTPADPMSPQTEDNSQLFLWLALLFISGGALAGTVVYRKNNSSK